MGEGNTELCLKQASIEGAWIMNFHMVSGNSMNLRGQHGLTPIHIHMAPVGSVALGHRHTL
ncbi:rCG53017, partial [Rattus norvegicus]